MSPMPPVPRSGLVRRRTLWRCLAALALLLPAFALQAATVRVKQPSVILRAGPGVGHPPVDKLARGEVLEALERRGNWVKVNRYGVQGWVFSTLVSEPTGEVPDTTPRPEPEPAPEPAGRDDGGSPAASEPERTGSSELPAGARDNLLRTSKGDMVVEAFQPGREYRVEIQTDQGTIVARLWPEAAPNHVKNFLHLSRSDYYDGLAFHRVVRDFLIQGGDPRGDGTGGPGYTIPLETNDRSHEAGVLSMARRVSDENSAGSQFFILMEGHPFLDGKYTPFGSVVEGMEVVRRIGALPTNDWDQPLEPVRILDVTVTALEPGGGTT